MSGFIGGGSGTFTGGTLTSQLTWGTGGSYSTSNPQIKGNSDSNLFIFAGGTSLAVRIFGSDAQDGTASNGGNVNINAGNAGLTTGTGAGGQVTSSGGSGGGTSGDGGANSGLGGNAGGSGNGGAGTWRGGNASGTDKSAGGATHGTGASTGTGFAHWKVQTSFTLTTGNTTQNTGDRFFVGGKTLVLSNTSGTAQTIFQLAVPTSNSSGGCMVFYCLEANDGSNWDTEIGCFQVAASNKAGTVTAPAVPTLVGGTSNNNNSGTLTAAPLATTITTTNVNVRVTPTWATIVPTTVRISYTVIPFGNGVTVNPV